MHSKGESGHFKPCLINSKTLNISFETAYILHTSHSDFFHFYVPKITNGIHFVLLYMWYVSWSAFVSVHVSCLWHHHYGSHESMYCIFFVASSSWISWVHVSCLWHHHHGSHKSLSLVCGIIIMTFMSPSLLFEASSSWLSWVHVSCLGHHHHDSHESMSLVCGIIIMTPMSPCLLFVASSSWLPWVNVSCLWHHHRDSHESFSLVCDIIAMPLCLIWLTIIKIICLAIYLPPPLYP